jgi:hypothetical protein
MSRAHPGLLLAALTAGYSLPAVAEEDVAPVAEPVPVAEPAPVAEPTVVAAPEPVVSAAPGPTAVSPAPPLTVERLQTLRRYKAQRLVVREETEVHGGGTAIGFASPYSRMGVGSSVMLTDPIYTVRTWGVWQGHERLSTPTFLALAGEKGRAEEVSRGIERYDRRSKLWFTVAGVGAGVLVGGLVRSSTADQPEEMLAGNLALTTGVTIGLSGLVIGSFPASKAHRLQTSPASLIKPEEARELAERHNDALREELGVTAQEAWLIELGSDL